MEGERTLKANSRTGTADGCVAGPDGLDSGQSHRETIRVLLVDDHDVFRSGLHALLVDQGVQVVAEAPSAVEGVRLAVELLPDVVVMDLNMPEMSGLEATRQLAAVAPTTRVLVLTVSANEADVTEAILAGACGYLVKDASPEEILNGIRAAAVGESLISPRIACKLLDRLRSGSAYSDAVEDQAKLTERELEVLRRVAEGKGNSQIARELFVSPQTVKIHISNILAKLQIENRIQAAVYAVRKGIV